LPARAGSGRMTPSAAPAPGSDRCRPSRGAAALIIGYTTARSIQRPLQLIIGHWIAWPRGHDPRIDYQSRCEFGSLTRSSIPWQTRLASCSPRSMPARAIWWTRRAAPPR
jgi:hypothetical protein